MTKKLRLYIITINDSFYINPIIKWFIKKYHPQIVGVSILSGRKKNQSFLDYYKKIYEMFHFIGSVKLVCSSLLIKIKEILGYSDLVSSLIKRYKLDLIKTKSVNDPPFVSLIRSKEVDIILSFCGEIYKEDILKAVKIGVVNKHCSLLPKYRGAYPIFWAMLNNEKEIGTTLHLMDKGVDTGPILIQKKISLLPRDTMCNVYYKCHKLAPKMIKQVIDHFTGRKKLKIKKRVLMESSYFSYPQKKDIEQFYRLGYRII